VKGVTRTREGAKNTPGEVERNCCCLCGGGDKFLGRRIPSGVLGPLEPRNRAAGGYYSPLVGGGKREKKVWWGFRRRHLSDVRKGDRENKKPQTPVPFKKGKKDLGGTSRKTHNRKGSCDRGGGAMSSEREGSMIFGSRSGGSWTQKKGRKLVGGEGVSACAEETHVKYTSYSCKKQVKSSRVEITSSRKRGGGKILAV